MDGRSGAAPGAPRRVERINRQIAEYLRLEGWLRAHARDYPYLDVQLMRAGNGSLSGAQFWGSTGSTSGPRPNRSTG